MGSSGKHLPIVFILLKTELEELLTLQSQVLGAASSWNIDWDKKAVLSLSHSPWCNPGVIECHGNQPPRLANSLC